MVCKLPFKYTLVTFISLPLVSIGSKAADTEQTMAQQAYRNSVSLNDVLIKT